MNDPMSYCTWELSKRLGTSLYSFTALQEALSMQLLPSSSILSTMNTDFKKISSFPKKVKCKRADRAMLLKITGSVD